MQRERAEAAPQPTVFQTIARLLIIYLSIKFFAAQWREARDTGKSWSAENSIGSTRAQNGEILLTGSDERGRSDSLASIFGVPSSPEVPKFPVRDDRGRPIESHACTFKRGQPMQLRVYLLPDEEKRTSAPEEGRLVWLQDNLTFDIGEENTRKTTMSIPVDYNMANNGSVWAHIILSHRGSAIWLEEEAYRAREVEYIVHQMNVHRLRSKKNTLGRKLLKSDSDALPESTDLHPAAETVAAASASAGDSDGVDRDEIVNYWKPTLSLNIVDLISKFPRNQIPTQVGRHLEFHQPTGDYYPVIYPNEFWLQVKHYIPLNETLDTVPLELSYASMGVWKWQLMSQMEQQWAQQQALGLASDGDNDMMREMLGETAPWLLAVTFLVSILHSLFDFLAFKNDVTFWKKNKSLEGLSLRTMIVNFVFQVVILLYLMDSDTSFMILVSTGVGVAIELWKLRRAFNSSLMWVGGLPRLTLKAKDTYSKSDTAVYDEIATSHLLFLVIPLVLGYSIYSLLHKEHKSWYSWILTSLVGFVYMFGFINMTPQLYINYKLKSVAHLPWKAMVYKSLNTFVDDLFSFIIKMPTMHRLACFRDDIIFFIYLYQRWIYPIDSTRVNEYGQGGGEEKEGANESTVSTLELSSKVMVSDQKTLMHTAGALAEPDVRSL